MSGAVARVFLAGALIALAGCRMGDKAPAAAVPVAAGTVASAQAAIAAVAAPAAVGVRELVQGVITPPAPAVATVDDGAADLIIRWEVSGPDHYRARLERPVWPGGGSGITWGIGYDGGHNTAGDIRAAWADHAQVARLEATAGIAGDPARAALPGYADIIVPWAMARGVFADRSLPAYRVSTRRAFGGEGFARVSAGAQGALVSLVYNRGASMAGDRNAEKRAIRDRCLPAADAQCVAAQLRAMCRLWAGTPNGEGLCRRRQDEARLAEGAA